jgi:predicted methyltransferase
MLRRLVLCCCFACGSPTPATDPGPTAPPGGSTEPPVPVAPALNETYREQTDPKVWEGRFERDGREAHDHKAAILAALALRPGMAVADVGAGTGLFTLDFARAVGDDGTVFVVDVQDYFLDHIRREIASAGIHNAKFVKADQHAANLPAASIDLAFLCDVYHHIEYPKSYLASLRAALKDGGRLVVIDFKAIEGQSEAWVLDHVRGTPDEFRAEIEAAGFELAKSHEILTENFFFEFSRG